ncbi:hypothetical protein [Mycobacterium sp. 852002-51163_SCH5372311]|uniref:hypothetical protein n=1 Tax=Mycobacterium sp. 852002-51163_SCH5372311 TaxID=1834097 RepID=UPI0012E79D00|nr:hypothetical protein [Mycobacterium sp. 852002-51163_SCH5372311]
MVIALLCAFSAGVNVTFYGLEREKGAASSVVWVGVAVILLSVLIAVGWWIRAIAGAKKDSALRQRGTVELLTVASSYVPAEDDYWELTSEMQIRLDSGHTLRGSYCATVEDWRLRKRRRAFTPDGVEIIRPRPSDGMLPHFDEWFCVGASMRCLYNPTNPDKVLVFPFAERGDRIRYNEFIGAGSDYVWFSSAT